MIFSTMMLEQLDIHMQKNLALYMIIHTNFFLATGPYFQQQENKNIFFPINKLNHNKFTINYEGM